MNAQQLKDKREELRLELSLMYRNVGYFALEDGDTSEQDFIDKCETLQTEIKSLDNLIGNCEGE